MSRPKSTPNCVCLACGEPFHAPPSAINRGGGRYCSPECYNTARKRNDESSFWARVGPPSPETGCRLWTGAKNRNGYGHLGWQGKTTLAHRLAYELTYSPIPDGMLACHTCDNRPCCEPTHLFLGNNAENLTDMRSKGRWDTTVRGELRAGSRLTDDQVREIIALRGKQSGRAVARRFGVHHKTVSSIWNGSKWRHIERHPSLPSV